jgi:hypothetical protein
MEREYVRGKLLPFVATLLFALGPFISRADAQPTAGNLIALNAAVAPGSQTNMIGDATGQVFVVPPNRVFVLTDVIISPQTFPPTGSYLWQVTPSAQFFTTELTVTSTAADASSFQTHLTTGTKFHAGSHVQFALVFGGAAVNVSAFGYLD